MIMIKPGVQLLGLSPQILLAIIVARQVYADRNIDTTTITSVTDSQHSPTSLHHVGHAVDLRTRNIPMPLRPAVAADLKRCLGAEYDVVLEDTHIHIEWQPKGK